MISSHTTTRANATLSHFCRRHFDRFFKGTRSVVFEAFDSHLSSISKFTIEDHPEPTLGTLFGRRNVT